MVDKRSNPGDKSDQVERPNRTRCTASLRLAQRVESTGSVGSRGRGSRPASGPLESLPILSEDELISAYGLDPEDLELERILRARPC